MFEAHTGDAPKERVIKIKKGKPYYTGGIFYCSNHNFYLGTVFTEYDIYVQ